MGIKLLIAGSQLIMRGEPVRLLLGRKEREFVKGGHQRLHFKLLPLQSLNHNKLYIVTWTCLFGLFLGMDKRFPTYGSTVRVYEK